jgi:hypothetical protein
MSNSLERTPLLQSQGSPCPTPPPLPPRPNNSTN